MNKQPDIQLFNNSVYITKGKYILMAASETADTIGDIRIWNDSGWEVTDICTVANSTKFSGTWIRTNAKISIALKDNNMQYDGSTPPKPTTTGAFINLLDGKSGTGNITIGDMAAYCFAFSFKADGTVTIIAAAALNCVNTATNANLCIYNTGTQVAIINELGSELTMTCEIRYTS